jgi:hypothetical protein
LEKRIAQEKSFSVTPRSSGSVSVLITIGVSAILAASKKIDPAKNPRA